MNQVKIGKFISERRKQIGLTQMQLAEKLLITDRAVSKWERGLSLPDSAIMLELCSLLKITVNDLLSGEVVIVEDYNKELENKLIEMVRQKEESDKRLLASEIFLGILGTTMLLTAAIIASYVQMAEWMRLVIVLAGLVPLLVALPFMLKIEQVAGYYECKKCGHRYVPEFKSVLWASHMGRTRHMRCPKCGQKSWQKKVLSDK